MTRLIDILFTAPHTAVELAALIFCWLATIVAGWVALQLIGLAVVGISAMLVGICAVLDEMLAAVVPPPAPKLTPEQKAANEKIQKYRSPAGYRNGVKVDQ